MGAVEVPDARAPAYRQSVGEVLIVLDVDARSGLSEDEAHARLARHGPNELSAEKPVPAWRKFLAQFQDVLVILLLVLLAGVIGLPAEGNAVVLPLLATQILWINMVTDGAPALALGVDPADADVMARPPRPPAEGVITGRMWLGILFVGVVMATGTLLVLDAGVPGGLIEGSGTLRYAQTMAFTTLTLFQVFNVFNARSDERSAFSGLFKNRWLWRATGLSLALQVAVVHVPFLQQAFSTVSLNAGDWLRCAAVASSVLWMRELSKVATRAMGNPG